MQKSPRCQANAACEKKEKSSEGFATYIYKIDVASLFIFSCMFIIFNAIYWHSFLKSPGKTTTKTNDTVDVEAVIVEEMTMNETDEKIV